MFFPRKFPVSSPARQDFFDRQCGVVSFEWTPAQRNRIAVFLVGCHVNNRGSPFLLPCNNRVVPRPSPQKKVGTRTPPRSALLGSTPSAASASDRASSIEVLHRRGGGAAALSGRLLGAAAPEAAERAQRAEARAARLVRGIGRGSRRVGGYFIAGKGNGNPSAVA